MKTIILSLAFFMVTVNGHPHPQASGNGEGNKLNSFLILVSLGAPLQMCGFFSEIVTATYVETLCKFPFYIS